MSSKGFIEKRSFSSSGFFRVLKLGYSNFWRNRWLTLGATLLMTLTLTMISVSVLMSYLISDTSDLIRSKIDLTVYFRDDAVTDSQVNSLGDSIKGLDSVAGVKFVGKTEALAIFSRLAINEDIKKPLTAENNPLPRSLLITTSNPDKIENIANSIASLDKDKIVCSDCVSLTKNKNVVDRLRTITNFIRQGSILLSLFFGIIAIFNVLNIIKITIATRSDEIEIMRYVGASNMFVRGPFLVEGAFYGVLGTIFTNIFLLVFAYFVGLRLSGSSLGGFDIYGYVVNHLGVLVAVQLSIGVLLGIVVSLISLRRYLKA